MHVLSGPNIVTFSSFLNVKNKGTVRKLCIFVKPYSWKSL